MNSGVEIDWRGEHLYAWIPFYRLEEFAELLGESYFAEGGDEVYIQYEHICFDLVPLCEYWEIDPNSLLESDGHYIH